MAALAAAAGAGGWLAGAARAPQPHGRYTLTVTEQGHVSRAAVIVR